MATSALKDTHRAVTELTESGMEPFPAGAVVRLVKESITEGCASRADLDRTSAALRADLAEFAADINATIAAHKAETDMHFALWEERSKSFVTRDELAEAFRRERKHADARFARVWGDEGFGATRSDARDLRSEFGGLRSEFRDLRSEFGGLRTELKELSGRITELHEKMFGTAATWFKIVAGLVGLILVVLQIYQVFGS